MFAYPHQLSREKLDSGWCACKLYSSHILTHSFVFLQTRATGMFEVRFLDYTNPGNRNGQKTCCSGVETGGSCSSPCSTFFRVCLRPLTHTGSSCPFGQKTSDVLGSGSFVIPSNSLLQIPWPNTLQSWPVSTYHLTRVLMMFG